MELVIARPETQAELTDWEAAFPGTRFVSAADTATSSLRVAGMSAIQGDIVAIIDDTMNMDYGRISHLLLRQTGNGATLDQTRIEKDELGREWAAAFARHGITIMSNGQAHAAVADAAEPSA